MATDKRTRIKGLPPSVQLDQIDNTTGSLFPSSFNDRNTVIYGQIVRLNAGYNVLSGNTVLTNPEFTSSIYYSGSLKKGIADNFIQYTSSSVGSSSLPFKEEHLFASDGKSRQNPFYTTGSSVAQVGEGFSSPVWSKTKFEIDLGPAPASYVASNISLALVISESINMDYSPGYENTDHFVSQSYTNHINSPIGYYNFSAKFWEPIGRGLETSRNDKYISGTSESGLRAAKLLPLGFTPGLVNLHMVDPRNLTASNTATRLTTSVVLAEALPKKMFEYHKTAGRYTDQYGFPFAPKYHATGSQLFDVSTLIDRPFALEKVVLILSGVSYRMGTSITSSFMNITGVVAPYTINNFFILNQRKNISFNYKPLLSPPFVSGIMKPKSYPDLWKVPTGSIIAFNGTTQSIETIRDLVGYASIVAVTNDFTETVTRRIGAQSTTSSYPFANGQFNNQTFFFRNTTTALTESVNPVTDLFGDRELIINVTRSLSNSFDNFAWDVDKLILSFSVGSPIAYRNMQCFLDPFLPYPPSSSTNGISTITNENGGRNGLGALNPTGRDMVNSFGEPNIDTSNQVTFFKEDNFVPKTHLQAIGTNPFTEVNPYILMPGDQLIFGWQLPFPKVINGTPLNFNGDPSWSNAIALTTSIGNTWSSYQNGNSAGNRYLGQIRIYGSSKIVLYGSYLQEGKEIHNVENRILNTKAIQEIIIGDD
jgi:hypothetical protein